ncbi:MAG: hypothetical protein VYA55_06960 [Pseudomonadota bacterium]|nr:hypothetical protein [Pseudomonadota bacterium]
MLNLTNVENKVRLDLSIVGYQFPDDSLDNWCMVKAVVEQSGDKFEYTDPALDARDLLKIRDWFKCLSERKLPRFARLTFIEPCLEFEFLACEGPTVRIAIGMSRELKPSFELNQFGRANPSWRVVFELSEKEFIAILANMAKAIINYPVRGRR